MNAQAGGPRVLPAGCRRPLELLAAYRGPVRLEEGRERGAVGESEARNVARVAPVVLELPRVVQDLGPLRDASQLLVGVVRQREAAADRGDESADLVERAEVGTAGLVEHQLL